MSELLTFDPGVNHIGWAHFDSKGFLQACGLLRDDLMRGVAGLRSALLRVRKVVIELPEIYNPRFMKGDPNDLINVTRVVGAIEHCFYGVAEVRVVQPKIWKGQAHKDVTAHRVRHTLDQVENIVLGTTDCPRHLKHNVYDAIGLGLWSLGRKPKHGKEEGQQEAGEANQDRGAKGSPQEVVELGAKAHDRKSGGSAQDLNGRGVRADRGVGRRHRDRANGRKG